MKKQRSIISFAPSGERREGQAGPLSIVHTRLDKVSQATHLVEYMVGAIRIRRHNVPLNQANTGHDFRTKYSDALEALGTRDAVQLQPEMVPAVATHHQPKQEAQFDLRQEVTIDPLQFEAIQAAVDQPPADMPVSDSDRERDERIAAARAAANVVALPIKDPTHDLKQAA